jgi:aminopeptidase N
MKTFFVLALLCCTLVLQAQRPIDVQHYQFMITLSDNNDVINGVATISLKLNQKVDTIVLDLMQTMQVSGVRLGARPTTWKHENNQLKILNNEGSDKTIVVTYSGIPKDGLIISTNKFSERTFFADNWPDRARHWLPCVDDPADKASVEFIVTAPLHYQVVSNGVQLEETILNDTQKLTHWRETVLLPTKIMVIGVAKFAMQYVGDTLGVQVYSWVYPQEKTDAFYDYAQAKDILPFFINNIGPYPYRKLANVQSKTIFGGMENAGCIFYSEASISGKRQAEGLLTHEIAHQWFGDMATEKSFAHLWLSEGFATYMTDLYFNFKYGIDSMNTRLKNERGDVITFNKVKNTPVVDSATKDYMQLLNANSYQKGAWVLHMLRNLLGPDVFMQGVSAYYKRYAGSNASTDDFRKVMEEVSGKDLKAFFKQWLYTPGMPLLQVTHSYDKARNSVVLTVNQRQANAFAFPLEIEIQTAKGLVKKTLQVSKLSEQFTIPNSGEVKGIVVDPGVKLLFERVN